MTPRKRNRRAPAPGGESCEVMDLGEPRYHTPVGPVNGTLRLVPADEGLATDLGEPMPLLQVAGAGRGVRPLIPASEEVAGLPRPAREAFAARCAARVAALRPGAGSPEAAAALILAAATTRTPVRRQLLCIRRDFDRIRRLAQRNNWTDDATVPADVFGPMWPTELVPQWANAEPPDDKSEAPTQPLPI